MADRFSYTKFSDTAKASNDRITFAAKLFENELESVILPSREKSLALTKLEEAVMWARKALRDV